MYGRITIRSLNIGFSNYGSPYIFSVIPEPGADRVKKDQGRKTDITTGEDGDVLRTSTTVPTLREHRKQERKDKKEHKKKSRKGDMKEPVTTSIMFVDNTPHGGLCTHLQTSENRMGGIFGRRVKMVERGGVSLGQVLSNRNPWAGGGCSRDDCHPCGQGGGERRKDDCFKRNILYESRCGTCEETIRRSRREEEKKGSRL